MKLIFNINFHTVWGQKLFVVGSIPELGNWNPVLAKSMNYAGDGNWQLELDIPSGINTIEYRYFLGMNDRQVFEEWEKNHRIELENGIEKYTLYDYWQIRPANLAFYTSAFTDSLFAHPGNCTEDTSITGKKIKIKIYAPRIEKNRAISVTGNQLCLGNWDPAKAVPLNCKNFPEWHIILDADQITYPLEYKFIVCNIQTGEPLFWEAGENRVLSLPYQESDEEVVISGLYFRDDLKSWRGAGTVIPVFSLRSGQSFGVGDLGDLKLLIDWCRKTSQRIIQVLPMNDTTMTYTWLDSYPYSAISIYALHPIYISLLDMGKLSNPERTEFYTQKQQNLNANASIDYEAVIQNKIAYSKEYFEQEKEQLQNNQEFKSFISEHANWLIPYATFCYFRDIYKTPDYKLWGNDSIYNADKARKICAPDSTDYNEILFTYFLQFILHTQFKSVSDYAHQNGIVLKGDLPIGINRQSVEAWKEPEYFNMNSQAGAPPDDFSTIGQNWGFPTYNWDIMEKDQFAWWKKRFNKLSDYFDCFRIDHILGFFRIWEIPLEYTQGLCGHFNPAIPFTREEIEQYGLIFDETFFTIARIHKQFLPELFGALTDDVTNTYLALSTADHYVLKEFCNTQKKIETLFLNKTDDSSFIIRNGLLSIANEVLFLRDPYQRDKFHPRISASSSYLYRELNNADKYAYDQLYWHFFYHRHNEFWKEQAYNRLTPLVNGTNMLVCGEDLGMIPDSVPEVMNKLQILSLEIERMPKTPYREFADMFHLPYLSVCTTSTHDMNPLRNWWKEDREKTQRYYNNVLVRPGSAPEECTSDIATQIILNHLKTLSMLTIIPLQDWFGIDDTIKSPDIASERINVPANPKHYWRYRMHIPLEKLLEADTFNQKIISLIEDSGRK